MHRKQHSTRDKEFLHHWMPQISPSSIPPPPLNIFHPHPPSLNLRSLILFHFFTNRQQYFLCKHCERVWKKKIKQFLFQGEKITSRNQNKKSLKHSLLKNSILKYWRCSSLPNDWNLPNGSTLKSPQVS